MLELRDRFETRAASSANVADKVLIVQSKLAKSAFADLMSRRKSGDLIKEGLQHSPLVGEISPTVKPKRGIFRESRLARVQCHTEEMADIKTIRETVEREMKKKGFSRRSLSKAAELSESAIRDLLTRTENPGIDTLRRVAEALEMPVDALTGAGVRVPVLGKIGAGGSILFATESENEYEFPSVPRPPLVAGRLMALEVVGSSMLPKYDPGDIVYVRRDHEGVLPSYMGKYCAVRTSDGGTFLKILAAGSGEGLYTLRSLNAEDMPDVALEWASPVLFVMPRQAETN